MKAIEKAGIDIVPKMVVGGGSQGGNFSAFEGLMSLLLSEKLGIKLSENGDGAEVPDEIKRLRGEILASLSKKPEDGKSS